MDEALLGNILALGVVAAAVTCITCGMQHSKGTKCPHCSGKNDIGFGVALPKLGW